MSVSPRQYLQRIFPRPLAILNRPSYPLQRAKYALGSGVQKDTAEALMWMDVLLAERRRERMPISDPNYKAPIEYYNNLESSSSFLEYVNHYIAKPLQFFFDFLRSPDYSKLYFKAMDCTLEGEPVVEMQIQSGNWRPDISIFLKRNLDLELYQLKILPTDKKKYLVADPFGAVYLSEPEVVEKVCLLTLDKPVNYLLAAFIYMALPESYLKPAVNKLSLTYGAPNNPILPSQSADDMFSLCNSHSDFDRYELSRNAKYIEHFLQWKKAVRLSPLHKISGLVRVSKTLEWLYPFEPRYDLETLPTEAYEHFMNSRRRTYPEFSEYLSSSNKSNLSLVLENELTPEDGLGYSRTFICAVPGMDNQLRDVDAPEKLVIKLFDDKRGNVPSLEDVAGNPSWWSHNFMTAGEMLLNERNAYLRLKHVCGSAVPWFYGAFLFELPGGILLPGILLEHVEKSPIPIKDHTEDYKIKLIRSARHAVRVLQFSDITQKDWSPSQFIVSDEGSDSPTCVLIDFSLSDQGDKWHEVDRLDDYGQLADALMINNHNQNSDGVPLELLLKWYDTREIWDHWRYSQAMDFKKPHRRYEY